MNRLIDGPLFGVTISIFAFLLGKEISERTKSPICNPLLLGGLFVLGFLSVFKIDLDLYMEGGDFITFFIGPATVALAIPLYRNIDILKERYKSILVGIGLGSIAGLLTILFLSSLFDLDNLMIRSLLPKSTTAAIGVSIAESNGGQVELAAIFIVATGILGSLLVDLIYPSLGIDDRIARGVGLGTASHVMGTSKAMELGEVEGAFSSVAIPIAGIMTVFLIPWLLAIWF